ncbi:MAG: cell wall-binding repeat-containing protein [Desulfosporosinus sp.]|nr:cell wall-binding repeat-containing protein [Desulfosporosinus sp.]
MKIVKKALASLAIVGMTLTMAQLNAFADNGTPNGVTTARLSGTDRVGTAVKVANAGWTKADTAILAPSADANLVDALAAAPLAGKTAPILLTDNNTLTAATKDELLKLGVKNVYVVGAISQSVVNQVNAMSGVTAIVLRGSDRIGTAAAISSKLTAPAGSFIVGYDALADALSVASYSAANNYSILVANPDGSLPASEAAYLGSNVYIIGGPTLVADIPGATHLFGADRFATNQAVLNALNYQYSHVYVANGTDAHLVDSLVASSLAAESSAPIILTDTNSDGATAAFHDVQAKLEVNAVVTALGGPTMVSDADVSQITGHRSSINYQTKEFSEADAISKLIEEHPDFPANPAEIITRKLPTGGPVGSTANVKFSTSVENIGNGTYIITLTKDWGIIKSYWKYKVTSGITLTDSIDNDYLPNIIP